MNWIIDETENEFIIKIKQLNLKKENFKLVRFGDYFKQVKKTVNYSYTSTGENTGIYPLYSCKKLDKGVAKYVRNPEYIPRHGVLVIVRTRNATCGYCNYCFKPLAWISSSVYVYRPKFSNINLFVTSMILTRTISPKHLNIDTFNNNQLENRNVFVYLDDANVLSTEFKIIGVIPKLKIDKTKIRKIKFSDYFEKVGKGNTKKIKNYKPGPYPLLSCCGNHGISSYVDSYCIDTHGEQYISISFDGTKHCYVQVGKFQLTEHVNMFKPINEHININLTALLIDNQLNKLFYGWNRKINNTRLNQLECYVYFN